MLRCSAHSVDIEVFLEHFFLPCNRLNALRVKWSVSHSLQHLAKELLRNDSLAPQFAIPFMAVMVVPAKLF